MIALREATTDDVDAILALRRRCFPADDPEKLDPRFWRWEYGRGRTFVAEESGCIVASLGFVAQTYVLGGEVRPSYLAADAMVDPDHRGQRLFGRVATFARESLGETFVAAWQIRSAVLGGMLHAGWRIDGGARVLIRPLFMLPPLREGSGEPTRDVEWMASVAAEFFDGAHVQRSAQWLRWRYFENPLWSYDVRAFGDAWLVTRRAKLRGIDTLAIVDVAWRRGCSADATALLRRASGRAKTPLAATLVTAAHPAYAWFVRHAFLPGPHRFRLLVSGIESRERWQLAWGDTDHL